MAYATPADLAAWLGPAGAIPVDSTRLLTRASSELDDFLVGCTYNVDVNGNPTDATTIQAFNDACCAQVEWWMQNGDEFGDLSRIASYSIEGIALTFKDSPPSIAPRAKQILRVAGIYPSQTPIHLP